MKKLKTPLPVVTLALICTVVTGVLAVGFQVTDPIIQKAAEEAAQAARAEVLPQGDSFVPVEAEGLPARVTEVYAAANGAGYVMSLTGKGYDGSMKLMVGLDAQGAIVGIKALDLSHETPGMGSRVGESSFSDTFIGKDGATIDQVDTLTGATISSTGYLNAVKDALAAFELISGKEGV